MASLFTYPAWDDFVYAAEIVKHGIWEYQNKMYFSWGGRFVPTFLMSVSPWMLREATWAYQSAAALMILGFIAGCQFLLRSFFPKHSHYSLLPWAMLFTAFFTVGTTTIVQAYYWFMATTTYTFCLIAGFFAIGLLKRQYDAPSFLKVVALFILTTLVVGSNEMCVFLWNLLLLALIVHHVLSHKKLPSFLIPLFLFSICIGLALILAPGNFVRSALFEKAGQIGRTVGNGFLHVPLFSIKLLSLPLALTLIVFYRDIVEFIRGYFKDMDEKKQKWFLSSIWFSLFFFTTAMAFWAQGRKPVSRALNVVQIHYYLFLPFALYLLHLFFKGKTVPKLIKIETFVRKHYALLLILSFFVHENTRFIIKDYMGPFYEWRSNWGPRLELLHESKGKDITLKRGSQLPQTTGFKDLYGMYPDHLIQIYGMKSVIIESEPRD